MEVLLDGEIVLQNMKNIYLIDKSIFSFRKTTKQILNAKNFIWKMQPRTKAPNWKPKNRRSNCLHSLDRNPKIRQMEAENSSSTSHCSLSRRRSQITGPRKGKKCLCEVQEVQRTSWTNLNPGRRFVGCYKTQVRTSFLDYVSTRFWVLNSLRVGAIRPGCNVCPKFVN